MRVQRVVMPNGAESWTVLGLEGEPVPPVKAFLTHLQALNRSPTTVRTYATSLKLWLEFLARVGVDVDAARLEHVSRFVAWLRAPAENVIMLEGGQGRCSPVTVNRHLAALFSFHDRRLIVQKGRRPSVKHSNQYISTSSTSWQGAGGALLVPRVPPVRARSGHAGA